MQNVAMKDLPPELVIEVLRHVTRADLKRVHLVSKGITDAVAPILFSEVYFTLTPDSWSNLQAVSLSEHLRKHVHTLYFWPGLLPRCRDQAAWASFIDMRPFKLEYFLARAAETGESMYLPGTELGDRPDNPFNLAYEKLQKLPWDVDAAYAEYQDLLYIQEDLFLGNDFISSLEDTLSRFPALKSIRVQPWNHKWKRQPAIRSDGTICSYEKYKHWLKPKDPSSNALRLRAANETIWDDGMFRSSLLQDRTVSAYLFLPFLGHWQIQRFDMHMSLDGIWTVISLMEDMPSLDVGTYFKWSNGLPRAMRTADLSSLTSLRLNIQHGGYHELGGNVSTALMAMLATAVSVRTLELAFGTIKRQAYWTFDYLGDNTACNLHLRSLRTLILRCARTSEATLMNLLRSHKSTLVSLELRGVRLQAGGSWTTVLQDIRVHLSLMHFDARNLLVSSRDSAPERYLDSASPTDHQAMHEYITRGGPWPGLVSAASPRETA